VTRERITAVVAVLAVVGLLRSAWFHFVSEPRNDVRRANRSRRAMHVTDPTGIPINVRGFDGKVIGALHNGKIVEILRTSADTTGRRIRSVVFRRLFMFRRPNFLDSTPVG